MQNYKESFHYNFFVGSGSVLTDTTKSTADLAPLQLGLFDSKTYKALAPATSTSKVYEILIAMGSPNEAKIDWENANVSFKSVPIQANRLISWRKALPKKALNHVVTLGWDGVTDCKTIEVECGKTYSVDVEITGSPASRYFGTKPLAERFVYSFADCGDDCVADPEKLVDNMVLQINGSKNIGSFAHAEKLIKYTVDHTVVKIVYTLYTLTLNDEGSLQNLTDVIATYPTAEYVIRKSRSGIESIYEMLILDDLGAPAAYSTSAVTKIADCDTCPSGYTLVPKFYKYKVERSDAGDAAALTEIATVYPDGSAYVAPRRISYENGTSTYVVYTSSTTAPTGNVQGVYTITYAASTFVIDGITFTTGVDFSSKSTLITALTANSTLATKYTFTSGSGNLIIITQKVGHESETAPVVTVLTFATVTTAQVSAAGDIITYIGSQNSYCELSSPSTVAWVEGDGMYKITRDLCLVIGDQPCDDPETDAAQIAAITAFYEGMDGIVPDSLEQVSSGTCANSYTLSQYSNLMEDGCGIDVATFPALPIPFQGFTWAVCPCTTETPNQIDNIGIRITGAYVDTKFSNCSFEYDDYVELDLPKIRVRQGESIVEIGACSKPWAVTTIQFPQYPTGNGTNVKKQYIEGMVFKHQEWADTPRWREIYGFNYDFIDVNKSYKFYYLEFEAIDKYNKNTGYGGMDIRSTITFAFAEDVNTTAFEALLESWINSARPDLIEADTTSNLLR